MAKLSQLHKEWETSRQELKQCEAAEAGVFAVIEHVFPTQSKQIHDKDGCFPMGMSPFEAWGLIKARALVDSKIDNEAINIRKRIGKLKPTTALGPAAFFIEFKEEMQRLESIGAPMPPKEAKAITKTAFVKSGIYAPNIANTLRTISAISLACAAL